jgi:cell division ATPase FtsA
MDHVRAFCELHDISFSNGMRTSYTVLDAGETLVVSANVCDRAYLDEVTRLVEKSGYKAKPALVADSAARLVSADVGTIIVSVGTHETTILRLVAGVVVETLTHTVGTHTLAESLSQYRAMSVGEAHDVLSQYGLLQAHPDNAALSELFAVLAPIFKSVDASIKHSRMPYQHVRMSAPVQQIFVVGPGAILPGLTTAFSTRTGIQTDIVSPRDLAWDADTIPPLPPFEIHHILPHIAIASAVLGAKFHK